MSDDSYTPQPAPTNLERLRTLEKRTLKLEHEAVLMKRLLDVQTPLVEWALRELAHEQALRHETNIACGLAKTV